jgi:haloalkane dehalogenase
MLHGNPTWSFLFRDLVSAASAAGMRAIAPDHIGCGLSDKPQSYGYHLADHIDNLEVLLNEHLGLTDMDLVVHDWGGAIGMGYAVRHPGRVRRLVAMNTAAFLGGSCPRRIWLVRTPVLGELLVRGANAFARSAVRMATSRKGGLPPAVRAGYLAPYDSYANRIATLQFVRDIPADARHPTWATLEQIDAGLERLRDHPLLLCWGMRDFCFGETFLDMWIERFPSAVVHRVERAGHYLLEDAGDEVRAAILAFLG